MMNEATLRQLREQHVAFAEYHEAVGLGDETGDEAEIIIGIIDTILNDDDDAIMTEDDWLERFAQNPVGPDEVAWPSHVDTMKLRRYISEGNTLEDLLDG